MTHSLDEVIRSLEAFVPTDDDIRNELALYDILSGFGALENRARAAPAMFRLLERFPEADLGCPGPIVHELEALGSYEPQLLESLHRQPTDLSVWMVNRILNTPLPAVQRHLWLSELQAVLTHPLAPQSSRDSAILFLKHQDIAGVLP